MFPFCFSLLEFGLLVFFFFIICVCAQPSVTANLTSRDVWFYFKHELGKKLPVLNNTQAPWGRREIQWSERTGLFLCHSGNPLYCQVSKSLHGVTVKMHAEDE